MFFLISGFPCKLLQEIELLKKYTSAFILFLKNLNNFMHVFWTTLLLSWIFKRLVTNVWEVSREIKYNWFVSVKLIFAASRCLAPPCFHISIKRRLRTIFYNTIFTATVFEKLTLKLSKTRISIIAYIKKKILQTIQVLQ